MVVFRIGPSEAIAGCATGEVMADVLASRRVDKILQSSLRWGEHAHFELFSKFRRIIYRSTFCVTMMQTRVIFCQQRNVGSITRSSCRVL